MITTNDEELASAIRRFNSLGYASVGAGKGKITRETIQDPVYERHVSVGFNYRMAELCAAVALGQLERLRELIDMRIRCADLYRQALDGCDWLVGQTVPDGTVHSYWTYVLRLDNHDAFSWYDFRRKYREMGGDGIYAAWKLNHLEPVFRDKQMAPYQTQKFEAGLCPVAEAIQPKLFQFKTNYTDLADAERAADALRKTIEAF